MVGVMMKILALIPMMLTVDWLKLAVLSSALEDKVSGVVDVLRLQDDLSMPPCDHTTETLKSDCIDGVFKKYLKTYGCDHFSQSCRHWEGNCPTFSSVPDIPHLQHPLTMKALDWNHALEKNFGVANEKYFASQLPLDEACRSHDVKSNHKYRNHEHKETHHLILTMGDGYSCHYFTLFLRTLRRTGCEAKVVIFRSDAAKHPCELLTSTCGDVVLEPTSGFDEFNIETRRIFLALDYLQRHHNLYDHACAQIILTDFRDMFFQRNPFEYFGAFDADVSYRKRGTNRIKRRGSHWQMSPQTRFGSIQ